MEYKEFLESKIKRIKVSGFDISENSLNKNLFDFQKYIVKKSLKNGRKGIGIELKDSYFETACKNITNAMSKKLQLSLFE